ncbi:MAG: TonB-dependent receptor plug domain-containing protein, partial [Bacteroidota bacterium]
MQQQRIIFSFIFTLLIAVSAIAQRNITGKVMDQDGNTLPGATVVVPGTTTGVTSDMDGDFALTIPAGQSAFEVSFIGYLPETIELDERDYYEITLMPTLEQLQEVVVTALGIKREAKAIGYSVQQVEGDALSNANRINPLSGLAGQVAGLQIGESGSGAGGSQRILIRGANSLTGNNAPLFVIDGVPIDNSGGSSGGLFGGFDYGNAINNINLDDVESISVLKGGAASALYGARGQNGVIMITTRGGTEREGIGITYQALVSSATPLISPDFQTDFAQGSGGNFVQLSPNSWGPRMNGQQVTNFMGQTVTLNPTSEHPYDGFFRNSTSIDQSLTLDKRTETTGVLFSASWNLNNGIIKTNDIDKKSFNLRYDTKLADYLTLDARANYISQTANNRPSLGGSPDNPVYLFTNMPTSVTLDQLNPFRTVSGNAIVWNSLYEINDDATISNVGTPQFASSPLLQNPYWATEL